MPLIIDPNDPKNWTGSISFFNVREMLKRRTARQALTDSWNWLRSKIFNIEKEMNGAVPPTQAFLPRTQQGLLASPDRYRNNVNRRKEGLLIGRMYFFVYDPKHKKTLPYYDTFPLVFPIKYYKDGFLGINLHYLDIRNRSILFGKLMEVATNQRYNDRTRLRISYQILQTMGDLYKPCLKRYLMDHVRSRFIFIHPSEWEQALFLPVENFEKAPISQVWRDSRREIQ